MNKEIEIPEGYEAKIEGSKVIIREKESEDERTRKEIISFIEYEEARGNIPDGWHQAKRPGEWIAYLEKQKEQPAEWSEEDEDMIQDIIASIDTKIAASDFHEMENWLKSLRPQPKQEWSEENEKKLGKCIDAVSGYYSPEDKQELKNWLKSLRPQPHWKPSEEQMEALRKVTYKIGNSCFGKNWANDENLHSLYVALQKLM